MCVFLSYGNGRGKGFLAWTLALRLTGNGEWDWRFVNGVEDVVQPAALLIFFFLLPAEGEP